MISFCRTPAKVLRRDESGLVGLVNIFLQPLSRRGCNEHSVHVHPKSPARPLQGVFSASSRRVLKRLDLNER